MDNLYAGINQEAEKERQRQESVSETVSDSKPDSASPSYFEANKKKSFSYKDEEIGVTATLSVPESLPKGVVFLVRPIKEEERPEQYTAFKDALTEYKEDKEEEGEEELQIVHLPEDHPGEILSVKEEGEELLFSAKHFSPFVLIGSGSGEEVVNH